MRVLPCESEREARGKREEGGEDATGGNGENALGDVGAVLVAILPSPK